MEFRHAAQIWADFPELAAGVVFAAAEPAVMSTALAAIAPASMLET